MPSDDNNLLGLFAAFDFTYNIGSLDVRILARLHL